MDIQVGQKYVMKCNSAFKVEVTAITPNHVYYGDEYGCCFHRTIEKFKHQFTQA